MFTDKNDNWFMRTEKKSCKRMRLESSSQRLYSYKQRILSQNYAWYEAVASRSFNKDMYTWFDYFLAQALSKPSCKCILLHMVSS